MIARGQLTSPFELLVAVVIMGFVILLGLQSMHQLCVSQYTAEVHQQLEAFKTALQDTVAQRSTRSHHFNLPTYTCGGQITVGVRLAGEKDSSKCADFCGVSKDTCWVLTYTAQSGSLLNPRAPGGDIREGLIRKCVVIDPSASFIEQSDACTAGSSCPPGRCEDRKQASPGSDPSPAMELVDLAHPPASPAGSQNYLIPPGYYEFVNRTSDLSLAPTICAYHRISSTG